MTTTTKPKPAETHEQETLPVAGAALVFLGEPEAGRLDNPLFRHGTIDIRIPLRERIDRHRAGLTAAAKASVAEAMAAGRAAADAGGAAVELKQLLARRDEAAAVAKRADAEAMASAAEAKQLLRKGAATESVEAAEARARQARERAADFRTRERALAEFVEAAEAEAARQLSATLNGKLDGLDAAAAVEQDAASAGLLKALVPLVADLLRARAMRDAVQAARVLAMAPALRPPAQEVKPIDYPRSVMSGNVRMVP